MAAGPDIQPMPPPSSRRKMRMERAELAPGRLRVNFAAAAISVLFLAAVGAFGCWLVGTRSLQIGTDTSVYAGFFQSLGRDDFDTRLEPGFVLISYVLNRLGLSVTGYQTALFALLLVTVWLGTRVYHRYLGDDRGYLKYLSASLMLLYVSPMFVNGAINAVRQGLAALLVFAALLLFQQRRWWPFLLLGAIASSLHLSSALYLAFAPLLMIRARTLRYVAGAAFLLYVSGLSQKLVAALIPSLHTAVMTYAMDPDYQIGVRFDFAVFSIFWYLLPYIAAPLVRSPYRERIKESTAVYLVMLLPFFAIGWGYFSNRYLLPAWMSMSLMIAAMFCHSRLSPLRNPLLIRFGLLASCAAFYYYVSNHIVI